MKRTDTCVGMRLETPALGTIDMQLCGNAAQILAAAALVGLLAIGACAIATR